MNEKTLTKKFKDHYRDKYDSCSDVYNLHETAYGQCGQPDLLVNISDLEKTLFVEVKRHESLNKSCKGLRPSQKARITELGFARKEVLLLYKSGCARLSDPLKLEWQDKKDRDYQFNAFDEWVSLLRKEQNERRPKKQKNRIKIL